MIKSLQTIKNKNLNELWFNYLYKTREHNYNILRVDSLKKISNHSVLNYVTKTLENLNEKNIDKNILFYVEETLKWSDVAKAGSKEIRKNWNKKNYDLFTHNIGSSQIYKETNNNFIVETLIKTHGLIGQHIKGEVLLNKNQPLTDLIKNNYISASDLKEVLIILNECIIKAVSEELYNNIHQKVLEIIDKIVNDDLEETTNAIAYITKRIMCLNHTNSIDIKNKLEKALKNNNIAKRIEVLLNNLEFWFYDGSVALFNIEEQIKMLLIIYNNYHNEKHISFENLMYDLYFDYKDKKEINIYKKRIIETFLSELSIEDLINNNVSVNPHVYININKLTETLVFTFNFSLQARKLIDFCEVAYISDTLYQKAVFMLYDLFGFRRDAYDRFYNEIDYLNTMNASLNQKSIILNHLAGNTILDVGPGGGALMDLICEKNKTYNVKGIDLSENVIEQLNKKKEEENRTWEVVKGDALNLSKYFKEESIDSIIYSSIIHELYSYIEFDGKKFNHNTIAQTLKEAYKILTNGGRIIIRDGIMTEPINQYRIIEFKNKEDMNILKRYCNDFKGREVTYELLEDNKVKMLVNDAMEFLYTYTWGENSYPLEINEQFGYFTPSSYVDFIKKNLPNSEVIVCNAFLQSGYEENLLPKISIYDEFEKVVKLPNSTCIIVIEKRI